MRDPLRYLRGQGLLFHARAASSIGMIFHHRAPVRRGQRLLIPSNSLHGYATPLQEDPEVRVLAPRRNLSDRTLLRARLRRLISLSFGLILSQLS